MCKVLIVDKFSKLDNAKCEIAAKGHYNIQRRNMFFITVVSMAYRDVEVCIRNNFKYSEMTLKKDGLNYFYSDRLFKNDFEDIWNTFGLEASRSAFIPGTSQKYVKRGFSHMKKILPILKLDKVDICDENILELIEVLDKYNDDTFNDILESIKLNIKTLNKMITSVL